MYSDWPHLAWLARAFDAVAVAVRDGQGRRDTGELELVAGRAQHGRARDREGERGARGRGGEGAVRADFEN